MDFTFGIITDGTCKERVKKIIDSIVYLDVPDYEIIVVGGDNHWREWPFILHFPFRESEKPGWITKKKNMMTRYAQFENIVYLHDYIVFDESWYVYMEGFGNSWDVCMNRIENKDGTRYRDWVYWDHPRCMRNVLGKHQLYLAPYEETDTRYLYFSGAYWVAKKKFMLKHPLNEKKVWGRGEDVEWSMQVRTKGRCKVNPKSVVRLLKQKDVVALPS